MKTPFFQKILAKILYSLPRHAYQVPRILFYRLLSDAHVVSSGMKLKQPVLMTGKGLITLGKCELGVSQSPHFFSGYSHLEARESSARIVIKDGVFINNNFTIICDRTSIEICEDTLIGPEFCVFDSDFHDLNPKKRQLGTQKTAPVKIGKNVFIGSRVTVLKGVTIGDNSVIGASSLVTTDIPSNVIASGVPAKIIVDHLG